MVHLRELRFTADVILRVLLGGTLLIGDASVFAFYSNKQNTAGEGGVIVASDDNGARLARSLREQGRGEMSAALGISQLRRIEQFLEKREHMASWYTERGGRHSRQCFEAGNRPSRLSPYRATESPAEEISCFGGRVGRRRGQA